MNNTEYKLRTSEPSKKNSGRPRKGKQENTNDNAIEFRSEANIVSKTIADDANCEKLIQFLAIEGVYQPPVITGIKASYFNDEKIVKEKTEYERLMKDFKHTVKSEGYKSFFFIKQQTPKMQYKDGQLLMMPQCIKIYTQIFSIEFHQMKEKYNQEDYKQMCETLNLAFQILDDGFARSLEYLANEFYEHYEKKKNQNQDNIEPELHQKNLKQEIIEHWKLLLLNKKDQFKEINEWIVIKTDLSPQYKKIMSIVSKVLKAQNSEQPKCNKKESLYKKQIKKQNQAAQKDVAEEQDIYGYDEHCDYQQILLDHFYDSFISMIMIA